VNASLRNTTPEHANLPESLKNQRLACQASKARIQEATLTLQLAV
jgi:hypothetical protein